MTSVKEVDVERPATREGLGRGRFRFTDAYSVFDWGRMPDAIPDKGASLCAMGADNFERLEAEGVPTHYRGVVDDGAVVGIEDATSPPDAMAVDLARVPDLPAENGTYDYGAFHDAAGEHYLVPLEVVFRNAVPVGSSLRSRRSPEEVGLDGTDWPERAVDLAEPVVEFSTKFEAQDRYLDRAEADRIAGRAALDDLTTLAREVNRVVTERAESVGMTHEDGKIECLYAGGDLRVADVVGTLDENRFTYAGRRLSKEFLRRHHKRTQPEWAGAVAAAKSKAEEQGRSDWRALCDRTPEPLSERIIGATSDLYTAGANAYLGRELFDAPGLEAAVAAADELRMD